jgi:hypothetical protein
MSFGFEKASQPLAQNIREAHATRPQSRYESFA